MSLFVFSSSPSSSSFSSSSCSSSFSFQLLFNFHIFFLRSFYAFSTFHTLPLFSFMRLDGWCISPLLNNHVLWLTDCLTRTITETLGVGSVVRCVITNIFGSDTKDSLRLTLSSNPKAVSSATLDLSDTTNLALLLPGTAVNTTISKVGLALFVPLPNQWYVCFSFLSGPGTYTPT